MKFKKFINQCREKDVLKNLSIYIVSSWVLLQVVALIAEPLGFSSSIVAYLLLLLMLGFPLYIYWVWEYQLAATIKKKPLLDKAGNPIPGKFTKSAFQKTYFSFLSIISIIAVGISVIIVRKNFVTQIDLREVQAEDKIAVLKFDNNTGDEKYDIAGKMAVDWIIHGITQNKVGQVISPEVIADYSTLYSASLGPSSENDLVTDYLKPSKIVEGEFFLDKNKLLFLCSIRDVIEDKTLISFETVECNPESPLECIEVLKERILGFLVTEENRFLSLQDTPPSFEAYKYLNRAKNQSKLGIYDDYLDLLNAAIASDSNYFEPKVYKFMYYYNVQEYGIADSLLQKLTTKADVYDRQQILINLYKGLLEGDNKSAYEYQQKEYNYTPFHMETNTSMMTLSLQLVNKPQAVDSIYGVIDIKGIKLQECENCVERYKIKALANIELQKYDEAIALLEDHANLRKYTILKKVLLRAYIRSARYDAAQKLLSTIQLLNVEEWMDIYLFAAKEFVMMGEKEMADQYLKDIISSLGNTSTILDTEQKKILAESLYLTEQYSLAQRELEEIVKENPSLYSQKALLAIIHTKNKNTTQAEAIIKSLTDISTDYLYGKVDYAIAQYYAAIEDDSNTFEYLYKAIAAGHWYETSSFQNDYMFRSYFQKEEFEPILNYCH
ncbi:hypothetical protein [Muriicola sp. Z0-33]|uniref:tetratricopeptide repeat protein n=1 Tax=Muriicola sp. Z0-33 TaxID=2816957 RepID=UPI00223822A7|nr:hypothetical protein [Muriicola sp. Z0-33]MCW5517331.1 hypothetical protein [Muriicola sp. Z0-33]